MNQTPVSVRQFSNCEGQESLAFKLNTCVNIFISQEMPKLNQQLKYQQINEEDGEEGKKKKKTQPNKTPYWRKAAKMGILGS